MKKIIYIFIGLFLVSSCRDSFEEINTNPNSTTKVPVDFLATQLILNLSWPGSGKGILEDSWLMKSSQFTEGAQSRAYNLIGTSGFSSYRYVIDAHKMVEIAEADVASQESVNTYKGLMNFYKADVFYNATMRLGDIPTEGAFQGEEGVYQVKYAPQEKVFGTILNLLDSASTYFSIGGEISADPVFNGNPELWERMVNSYTLRVLNMLSEKTTVDGINVQQKFEAVANRKLIESEDKSFQRTFDEKLLEQVYPFNELVNKYSQYPVMSNFLVDMLKKYKDRRLFFYAEPAKNLASNGEGNYTAYSGVDPVAEFSTITSEVGAGNHSRLNNRYHKKADGEPIKFVSYSETQFILAEAAVRGWNTPESVEAHYANAVKASMNFTASHTPSDYNHGVTVDDSYLTTYLNGTASISSATTVEEKLKLILEQKYIASFIQLPWNSFFDYRRTGYPELPINPATNQNQKTDRMPSRWRYPTSELSENKDAIEEALKRQFGGADLNNELMWLLK
ncbi:MAG: SusD/RagB family nutrient-binding outer membrane lipoprotein [Carboxylicivirga sp.]|jgi:hypothetical protein|nr:SusD/RagB family nutrient-binding outer membrane lipoprotein [Carboxylicivirga sp.]